MKASNASGLAPGCRLDRYDLLLQAAEGGMATLWLARQEGKHGFDKLVAIKTILPKLAPDPGFRRMFLDEARVVARIEHPNVAQVLDLGEERGVLFLVMEWIDGGSLSDLGHTVEAETNARIPVGILTRIMMDVCAGLHAAHELTDDQGLPLGVVHRDISPDNLLVGFRGTTKVIDFGIAKARNRAAHETTIGTLKGKIAFMAPEQAMGNGVNRRADIWSAGASMYRFLAGSVPYDATEPLAVLRRVTEGRRPAPLPKSVPAPIRRVVEKAIEPDANKRFATAHEMGVALELAMHEADVYATREDVAAFMNEVMGDARAKRSQEIEHAVRESRSRMRVEAAHRESASVKRARESDGLAGGSDERSSRPSRHPTAVVAQPPADARSTQETVPREPIDSVRTNPEMRGTVIAPIAAPMRTPHRRSRALGRSIAGAAMLGALVAAGVIWRAARLSGPLEMASTVAPSVRAPASSPITLVSPSAAPEVQGPVAPSGPPTPLRASRPTDEPPASSPRAEPSAPQDSEALTHLAEAEEAQGATARAIGHYRRAIAVNPRYLPARLGLAASLWASGQRDDARAAYRAIVTQFPAALCPDLARERAAREAGDETAPR